MRLHSPQFEKRLRRGVRREVKRSSELKRELRKASRLRKKYQLALLIRPLISAGLGIAVWQMLGRTGHPAAALALINLWAFVFVFIHAQRLLNSLYRSRDIGILVLLPVSEKVIFRWELQKAFRGALWSFLDFLSGYIAVAGVLDFSVGQWCAVVPIAAATWLETIALAALAVAYAPRLPYQLAMSSAWAILFLVYMARPLIGNAVIELIDACAPSLNFLLPTGWPVSLFQALLPGSHFFFLAFALPLGLTILSLRRSLSRLAAKYSYGEPIHQEMPDLLPEGVDVGAQQAAESDPSRPLRIGPTAIEEIVLTRQFLAAPTWPQSGRLEKALWSRLNLREQALTEFIFPYGAVLSVPWRKVFRNLGIACLAGFSVGTINLAGRNWIMGAGLFVTICQALAQFLANGRAFQLIHYSGVNIPLYAGFGVGFRELANVLLKCSLVQVPWLLSFATFCGMLISYLMAGSIQDGALLGFKSGGLLLASRFLFIIFAFSSGTNDTSTARFRSFLLILIVIVCALCFVGLAVGSLFMPNQSLGWLFWALAALDAYVFFRLYGWFYDSGAFDLMSIPRN